MRKFGLKLWSANYQYIEEAIALYEEDFFQYIELYIMPGTYDSYIKAWKGLDIPFVIHAPHFAHGLNLADRNVRDENFILAKESIKFADKLKAQNIIFHPGINGKTEETVSQLKVINDERIIIENKPYFALSGGLICNGSTPSEIEFIAANAKVGFCFDMGHAVYSANARKINPMDYIREFIKLNPEMYHLTDGDYNGVYDRHDHFGEGSFPVKDILRILNLNAKVTIETKKDNTGNLTDFIGDLTKIKKICAFDKIDNIAAGDRDV